MQHKLELGLVSVRGEVGQSPDSSPDAPRGRRWVCAAASPKGNRTPESCLTHCQQRAGVRRATLPIDDKPAEQRRQTKAAHVAPNHMPRSTQGPGHQPIDLRWSEKFPTNVPQQLLAQQQRLPRPLLFPQSGTAKSCSIVGPGPLTGLTLSIPHRRCPSRPGRRPPYRGPPHPCST